MMYPIIPDTSLKALQIFGIKEDEIDFSSIEKHEILKAGNKINPIDILIRKIEKLND